MVGCINGGIEKSGVIELNLDGRFSFICDG